MFGGPMSANDEHDYIRRELEWLAVPLGENAPFFGVCLGAQLLAKHLGARVGLHSEGNVEVGYYPLHATDAGQALMPWPDLVYQWHREGFDLPRDAVLLAEGETFPNQAYRFGNSFGIQFHVELTLAMVHRWTTRGHERLNLPGAQPRQHHFEQRAVHDHQTLEWLNAFLDYWLGLGPSGREAAPPIRATG
jgi:GMP synthase (glutamine-hydrolysing)